jgi:glutamyl-tRNA reductase
MVNYKSINHTATGLEGREEFIRSLCIPHNLPHVFLQTCNRIEFYWGEGEIPLPTAEHLFRVVSGLESGLLGESAIKGQVKNAYGSACETWQLSPSLHKLFQTAFRVAKLVRSKSAIGQGAVSHGQATVEIISKSNINLNKALITLIGVNKLTEDTIRFLQNKGAETLFVANRSYEKAIPYAEKYNCQLFNFKNIKEILSLTDILISATSAPHTVISNEVFPKDKEMMIFDLAFPRDIDAAIGHLPNVQLFNLENIEQRIGLNLRKRKQEIRIAEQIINEEIRLFHNQFKKKGNTKICLDKEISVSE